jgi:hypothetical protein
MGGRHVRARSVKCNLFSRRPLTAIDDVTRSHAPLSLVDYDVVTDARLSRLSLDAPYTERRVVLQLTISTPVAQTVTESVTRSQRAHDPHRTPR